MRVAQMTLVVKAPRQLVVKEIADYARTRILRKSRYVQSVQVPEDDGSTSIAVWRIKALCFMFQAKNRQIVTLPEKQTNEVLTGMAKGTFETVIYSETSEGTKISYKLELRIPLCKMLEIPMAWYALRMTRNRAQVWRVLLRNLASYSDVFWTVGEGYILNNFLPFRLGELGRAFLLSRKSDMKFMEILPTIVIERAMDLGYSAIIFLAAIPFVVGAQGAERIAVIVGIVILVGFVFLYILARSNKWALDLFHKLSARWPAIQRFGGSFLESFFAGLSVLTDGWLFLRFIFWMTLNWATAIVSYYCIIRAFFPEALAVGDGRSDD